MGATSVAHSPWPPIFTGRPVRSRDQGDETTQRQLRFGTPNPEIVRFNGQCGRYITVSQMSPGDCRERSRISLLGLEEEEGGHLVMHGY